MALTTAVVDVAPLSAAAPDSVPHPSLRQPGLLCQKIRAAMTYAKFSTVTAAPPIVRVHQGRRPTVCNSGSSHHPRPTQLVSRPVGGRVDLLHRSRRGASPASSAPGSPGPAIGNLYRALRTTVITSYCRTRSVVVTRATALWARVARTRCAA